MLQQQAGVVLSARGEVAVPARQHRRQQREVRLLQRDTAGGMGAFRGSLRPVEQQLHLWGHLWAPNKGGETPGKVG